MTISYIGIIGAGAWGTALAQAIHQAGSETVLWSFEPEVAETINKSHENDVYLPGIKLDAGIRATAVLEEAASTDAVFLVVPAQFLRGIASQLAGTLARDIPVVVCAKGIEQNSAALMSEVVGDTLPGRPVAVVSGPTFASEVAIGLPTAITLATQNPDVGNELIEAIGTQKMRPYLSDDVIGAEIGGAVKNVLAIACGVTEGRGFGDSARAALITRGLAEMTRLCVAKGGKAESMMGLSGLGDLTLTCSSSQSRNYSLGEALGKGETLEKVLASRNSIAEGVTSAAAVSTLAKRLGIEMPITEAVAAIVDGKVTVDDAIEALLARPFQSETRTRR
ncbi:MAG: glycerol-3-phosphate acyltransferase [Rhodospirillaceae bacterium]|nr:glycerol-3-phosphate acyltransferase [Rhodospirillaceae bacterium]|tara:strand:+ start:27949 stop:28956 length:1008 start_codon:yes stop_codon:yes gene_type:complete